MKDRMVREGGVTLIEMLISLVLVGLALLALSALWTTAKKHASFSQKLTKGTLLAQEKIEELSSYGYDLHLTDPQKTIEDYEVLPDFPAFKRVVFKKPDSPVAGLQTLRVIVYWDQDGHSVALSTVLGE